MWEFNIESVIVLGIATVLSLYLLVILAQLHFIHRSPAWAFIFTGLALLAVEATGLVLERAGLVHLPRYALDIVVLAKAICYAIGFTIWKRNLQFNNTLRRLTMQEDDEKDDEKQPEQPAQPERPEHPGTPARPPGKPESPQPSDPGDPQGPGR